jgi:hypothetical protein
MLEPDALKGSSPVLRRGRASNRSFLFDSSQENSIFTVIVFCFFSIIQKIILAGCLKTTLDYTFGLKYRNIYFC